VPRPRVRDPGSAAHHACGIALSEAVSPISFRARMTWCAYLRPQPAELARLIRPGVPPAQETTHSRPKSYGRCPLASGRYPTRRLAGAESCSSGKMNECRPRHDSPPLRRSRRRQPDLRPGPSAAQVATYFLCAAPGINAPLVRSGERSDRRFDPGGRRAPGRADRVSHVHARCPQPAVRVGLELYEADTLNVRPTRIAYACASRFPAEQSPSFGAAGRCREPWPPQPGSRPKPSPAHRAKRLKSPKEPLPALPCCPAPARYRMGTVGRSRSKWDGFRAFVSEDGLRVRSRRGRNMTAWLPELDDLPAGLVLDAEMAAFKRSRLAAVVPTGASPRMGSPDPARGLRSARTRR
jgi:hypothetical protein